jgi:hypothetical protein
LPARLAGGSCRTAIYLTSPPLFQRNIDRG